MQSIYGFRGAHLANILKFTHHFTPADTRPLQATFRFGESLVDLANRIQGRSTSRSTRARRPARAGPDTTIECFLAADDTEEAAAIADDIASAGGAPWADTAVLCRKRRLIRAIVDALEERDIPVEVIGASGLLDRPEVVDLVAWLEVLADPAATVALLRILQGPRYRVGLRDLAALARHAAFRSTAAGEARPRRRARRPRRRRRPLRRGPARRLERFCAERAELSAAALRLPVLDLAETIILRTGLWRGGRAAAAGRTCSASSTWPSASPRRGRPRAGRLRRVPAAARRVRGGPGRGPPVPTTTP